VAFAEVTVAATLTTDAVRAVRAVRLADLGAPAFACTPDQFPGLMAAAIEHRGIAAWAGEMGITVAAPVPDASGA
jgi:hypothetical protein